MKLVALWLVVLGFAIITASSCSISHRSDDFACTKQSDCSTGRTCTDGYCVAPQLDSGVNTDGPTNCPAQCTSCNTNAKTCTIDCALNGTACNQQVTCPVGWSCNIDCSTPNSCRNGVTCANSQACTITCSGAQSCRTLTCGAGRCNVDCIGNGSCRNVTCGQACACDITCQANSLCANLTCKAPPNCTAQVPLLGCTSLTIGCNTCP
jgi:hypothetical protein